MKRENRHSSFHGNRYYEGLKLKLPGGFKPIWFFSIHRESKGPSAYANNGRNLEHDFTTLRRSYSPIIYVGDMNCQPGDVPLDPNLIARSGGPTRRRANPASPDPELDFAAFHGLNVTYLYTDGAGGQSDHSAVAFCVDVPKA